MALSRRSFLQGVAGAAALSLVPGVTRLVRASSSSVSGFADPAAFASGVASFDPTHDAVLLWTRAGQATEGSVARLRIRPAGGFDPLGGTSLFDLPAAAVMEHTAVVGGGRTVTVDATDLPAPGAHYWYQFEVDGQRSAIGRTKTAPDPTDPQPLRIASTSCHSWQDGFYAAWWDIADQDLDAVVFLGDYIYEYPTDAASAKTVRPYAHLDTGAPLGEALSLEDYRHRYRLYRSDPALRAAHRSHPFVCIWDDHEIAGDRWREGAKEHGNDDGTPDGDWESRKTGALQAYFEFMPTRGSLDPGRSVHRALRFGGLASFTCLDGRAYRDQSQGGFNSGFDPRASLDVPEYSQQGRTMLGASQKQWLKDRLAADQAAGVPWKILLNQTMITPLNYASLPDALGTAVADFTRSRPELPVTYHRDGIPVNGDQWDGYQAERREILEFIRHGADIGESATKQIDDLSPGASAIADVVVLTGDIHIGWTNEVVVDQGDAGVDDPVAAEIVCPGISSENLNERVGMLTLRRPLPEGTTNKAGAAAIALNPHVRYVDFDASGYTLVEVTPDAVKTRQRVVTLPAGANPLQHRPMQFERAPVVDATGGAWQVRRGSSRLIPLT